VRQRDDPVFSINSSIPMLTLLLVVLHNSAPGLLVNFMHLPFPSDTPRKKPRSAGHYRRPSLNYDGGIGVRKTHLLEEAQTITRTTSKTETAMVCSERAHASRHVNAATLRLWL